MNRLATFLLRASLGIQIKSGIQEVIYDEDIPYDDETSNDEFGYDIGVGEMENIQIDNIEELVNESIDSNYSIQE